MDLSLLSGLSAGGIGGVTIALAFLLYKCCEKKKLLSKCCGAEIDITNETPSIATVQIAPEPVKPTSSSKKVPQTE